MPRPDQGRGLIKPTPHAKVIVLPECANCGKLAPECRCGRPKLYEGR